MNGTDENTNREKIDRWLDAALPHYNEGEPRMGFEGRILATLEADRKERQQQSSRWPWRLVAAAAVALVLIVVVARAPWRSTRQNISAPPEIATGASGIQRGPQPPVVATLRSNPTPSTNVSRRQSRHIPAQVVEAPAPRLAQFPAPRPLSEQERLLIALADNATPDQLAEDAALQQHVREELEEARLSGGGMPEPRGK